MQVGLGFWASKTLLAAVKLGLFTFLEGGARSAADVRAALGLHGRNVLDFLDALVSLGFLDRDGVGPSAIYRNTADTAFFLVKGKPQYVGGFLEMANDGEYGSWAIAVEGAKSREGLRTGESQNEIENDSRQGSRFAAIYARTLPRSLEAIHRGHVEHPDRRLRQRLRRAIRFLKAPPHARRSARSGRHGHLRWLLDDMSQLMRCMSYDMPVLEQRLRGKPVLDSASPIAWSIVSGNFFASEPSPKADLVTMGKIWHSFNLPKKELRTGEPQDEIKTIGKESFAAIYQDPARLKQFTEAMSSIQIGFNFTFTEFTGWATAAGFHDVRLMPLAGPTSAAIAVK